MYYRVREGVVKAVEDASFDLDFGETLGFAGESGCGKTSIGLSLMRLIPPNGRIVAGHVFFKGQDLVKLSLDEIRKIRWKGISMVFQSAMNALNPVFKVGDQLIEALEAHEAITKDEARKRTEKMFRIVGLPASRMNHYPHEFSGGMKQRAIIAMSLLCNPDLVIADEPTTALDVVLQDQILNEIKELQKRFKMSMIMISHDLAVIAETCDNVAIMYGGMIVEYGSVKSVFKEPRNPYTLVLLRSYPSIRGRRSRLLSLPGAPPSLLNPPKGCRFRARCPFSKGVCKNEPSLVEVGDCHYSRCHFASDLRIEDLDQLIKRMS